MVSAHSHLNSKSMHERWRDACRFGRRLLRFFTSFQVELGGNYSVERIQNLTAYNQTTSSLWALLVAAMPPFPCLVVVALIDSIPLAAPEEGSRDHLFWFRDYVSIALMTRAILEQFRIVPGLKINSMKTISMPIISSASAIVFKTAMASVIGFPLPFALVVRIPVWFAVLIICFAYCFGRALKQDAQLFQGLVNYVVVLVGQVLLTFVYPAYLCELTRIRPSSQKFYVILLPVIKIIAKN